MFGQQNKLKELFGQYGWELVDSQTPNVWWFVEIWRIKSIWSPTDCNIFLSFEVDPEWTDRARAAFGVYRIVAALDKPVDWLAESETEFPEIEPHSDNCAYIYLGRGWEKRIPEFFNDLANLRGRFDNLKKR
jgi:hypothetical protein